MVLVTRRQFVRKASFAATLCGCSATSIGEAQRLFDAGEETGARLDLQTIHKLASTVVGHVITPDDVATTRRG